MCQALGSLPLAIQIAGGFLALHPETTILSYLDSLRARGAMAAVDQSEADSLQLQDQRTASIAASLQLAYDSIRDDEARQLFQALCILPEDYTISRVVIPFLLGIPDQSDANLSRSLAWLTNSGLVHIDGRDNIAVHPLARSFGRSLVDDDGRRRLATITAHRASQGLVRLFGLDEQETSEAQRSPKIFLCYAGPDREEVDDLFDRLSGDGFCPWMDKRSLLPGQDWRLEIRRAIESADYFIACISKRFQERTYTNKEIKLALDVLDMMPEGAIFLIPLRLEECPVQDRLSSRQWVDLFATDGYDRLLRALRLRQLDDGGL